MVVGKSPLEGRALGDCFPGDYPTRISALEQHLA